MSDSIPNDAPVVPRSSRRRAVTELPPDLSPEVASIAKSIGNVSMAQAIVDVDQDVLPSDAEALNDFLIVTSGEATKALKQYLKLNSTIGRKLSDAYRTWQSHKRREAKLFGIIANGGTLPDRPDATAATR